jgi:hypothetical protein
MKRIASLLLIGAFGINSAHVTAVLSTEAGSFPLSEHGPSGTPTKVTGRNSASAAMSGRVTKADALEACERNLYGSSPIKIRACVKDELSSVPTNVRATANCPAYVIHTARGDRMTLVGYSDGAGVWKMEDGKLLEDSGLPPAVGRVADAQFKILCPAFAGNLPKP